MNVSQGHIEVVFLTNPGLGFVLRGLVAVLRSWGSPAGMETGKGPLSL
jgi:hypothetical protein